MRLTDRVYLVGSGNLGFGISDEYDCHVYLLDGGSEMALIDAGVGREIAPILENMKNDGVDIGKIKYLLLTHAHADHAGGSKLWRDQLGVQVMCSKEAASYLRAGNETAISLAIAKQAGYYPQDYRFQSCEVHRELREGDVVNIGDCGLQVIETPGHCSGMLSYYLSLGSRNFLFCGDAIFHGGKIHLSNVWDCDLQQYIQTIEKLSKLSVDALLPGHLSVALSNGGRHIQRAWDTLSSLSIPPGII